MDLTWADVAKPLVAGLAAMRRLHHRVGARCAPTTRQMPRPLDAKSFPNPASRCGAPTILRPR